MTNGGDGLQAVGKRLACFLYPWQIRTGDRSFRTFQRVGVEKSRSTLTYPRSQYRYRSIRDPRGCLLPSRRCISEPPKALCVVPFVHGTNSLLKMDLRDRITPADQLVFDMLYVYGKYINVSILANEHILPKRSRFGGPSGFPSFVDKLET